MSRDLLSSKYKTDIAPDAMTVGEAENYPDLINLSIGDPDINTPKVILDNAFADAYAGHTKYTDTRGYPELRRAICDFYKNRYEMNIGDKEVCVTTSGEFAMWLACHATVDRGDEIIIVEPYFYPYQDAVKMAGGVPVFVGAVAEENFQLNFDRLEAALTEKTKGIIINNPNNPTGAVYTLETLEKLAEFAKKHDLMVLADDIYTSFDFTKRFIPIASLPGMFERTVTVNSFSKNFVMTGMRIGNIVAPDYVIKVVQNIIESTTYSAPSISQRAALHGYRHFDEFEKDVVNTFKERVDYAYKRLSAMPFIDVMPVSGSFYIFPSVKKTGLTGREFAKLLMEKCHIKVVPGIAFGPGGNYHFRISCTVGLDKLKEAFDRMEKMFE